MTDELMTDIANESELATLDPFTADDLEAADLRLRNLLGRKAEIEELLAPARAKLALEKAALDKEFEDSNAEALAELDELPAQITTAENDLKFVAVEFYNVDNSVGKKLRPGVGIQLRSKRRISNYAAALAFCLTRTEFLAIKEKDLLDYSKENKNETNGFVEHFDEPLASLGKELTGGK